MNKNLLALFIAILLMVLFTNVLMAQVIGEPPVIIDPMPILYEYDHFIPFVTK